MNFPIFNHSIAPKSEYVVVIAGGPSTGQTINKISEYISKYNPIVFSANYNYGIKANYTCFFDMRKFEEQSENVCNDIILRNNVYRQCRKQLSSKIEIIKTKYNIFLIGSCEGTKSVYREEFIKIDEFGNFPYSTLGATGFGSILAALMCKPKYILFTGLDGPIVGTKKRKMWDGSIISHKETDIKKDPKIIRYFQNCLFKSLYSMGIAVQTFNEVCLYGLNKKELHIEVIN